MKGEGGKSDIYGEAAVGFWPEVPEMLNETTRPIYDVLIGKGCRSSGFAAPGGGCEGRGEGCWCGW